MILILVSTLLLFSIAIESNPTTSYRRRIRSLTIVKEWNSTSLYRHLRLWKSSWNLLIRVYVSETISMFKSLCILGIYACTSIRKSFPSLKVLSASMSLLEKRLTKYCDALFQHLRLLLQSAEFTILGSLCSCIVSGRRFTSSLKVFACTSFLGKGVTSLKGICIFGVVPEKTVIETRLHVCHPMSLHLRLLSKRNFRLLRISSLLLELVRRQ